MSTDRSEVDRLVADTSEWTVELVKRLAVAVARERGTVSANSLRPLLPAGAQGLIGTAVRSLALSRRSPLVRSGGTTPSTLGSTNRAHVKVYRLRRRPAVVEQAGVAA